MLDFHRLEGRPTSVLLPVESHVQTKGAQEAETSRYGNHTNCLMKADVQDLEPVRGLLRPFLDDADEAQELQVWDQHPRHCGWYCLLCLSWGTTIGIPLRICLSSTLSLISVKQVRSQGTNNSIKHILHDYYRRECLEAARFALQVDLVFHLLLCTGRRSRQQDNP